MSQGPFNSPGHAHHHPAGQTGLEMSLKAPRAGRRQRRYRRLRPSRVYLVAEAFLEAHRDAIEQALPWGLGQLSLTVTQVGGHTVGPFVHFPGLGRGKWTQGSQLPLFSKFLLLLFLQGKGEPEAWPGGLTGALLETQGQARQGRPQKCSAEGG